MPVPTLRIAEPCHESWAAMTPTGPGRHCAACQQTVVDFTHKTDVEILAALRQAAGQTCGRLRPDQLNRPLVEPAPAPRWRAWLGAVLAVGSVLGTSRAAAQAGAGLASGGPALATRPASHERSNAVPDAPRPIAAPTVLRGTVRDAKTHEGVPGATVLLKGTNVGTTADMNGDFALPIEGVDPSVTLTFSMIGYDQQEQTLSLVAQAPVQIELFLNSRVLGGLMVVEYQKPWPWHPRRFFNWGKYWVTKPFCS